MSPGSVRLLRVAAVVVPVALLLLLLHFLSPGLLTRYRESRLPAGYESIGEFGGYVVFARPSNSAAPAAARVLQAFTDEVLRQHGEELRLTPAVSRFEVIVFDDHEDLSEYSRGELGSDMEFNGGFYLPAMRSIGVVGLSGVDEIAGPLFHEATHMMLDSWVLGGDHSWSRWFNEGLATYFEASGVEAGRFRLGGYDRSLSDRMKRAAGGWIPVRELLSAAEGAYMGADNLLYYGGSALLVHWLLEGEGALRKRFLAYFEAERRPGPVPPGTFARIVGDLSEVDARLKAHVLSLD